MPPPPVLTDFNPPTGETLPDEGGSPVSDSSILEQIMEGTYGKLKGQREDINPRLTLILKTMHSLLMKALVMSTSTKMGVDAPVPEPMQRFQGEPMPDLNDD